MESKKINNSLYKVTYSVALISFLALFFSLSALNGWFFYELGLQIPLGEKMSMSIPFLVMGIAISFTASVLSVTNGKMALIAGLCFHLVSIGVTYSSLNFALNKQALESDKISQQIDIEKNKHGLKLAQINSAKSGTINQDQADLIEQRDQEIDALKRVIAVNKQGAKAGTVWDKTQGCTAKNWYSRNYADVCQSIQETREKYAAKVSAAAKMQENFSGAENSLDKQASLVSSQVSKVELPRIFEDENFNKQALIVIISLLFDVALVMLEWLLSGKIGAKTAKNKPAEIRENPLKPAETKKNLSGVVFGAAGTVAGARVFWRLLKAKNKQIKQAEQLKLTAEKEAEKAKLQLNSVKYAEGLEAMRKMTGFHVIRVFKSNNLSIDTGQASIIALICRTYESSESLARDRVYSAVNALPECKDVAIGRDKIEQATRAMIGLFAEEVARGSKAKTLRWISRPQLFTAIGKVSIAA